MEHYELVEGSSSKFWEVGVEGAALTVRFGRIGTQGQNKDKDFDSAAAAAKEKEKLVKEKTGKGYTLTGSAPSAPKPKASVPPVGAPPAPAAEPRAESATAVGAAPSPAAEPKTESTAAAPKSVLQPIPAPQASDELEALLQRALPTHPRSLRVDGARPDRQSVTKSVHDASSWSARLAASTRNRS